MDNNIKVGDIIQLPDNKRDMTFNKIGGLKVKILKIFGRHNQLANVEVLINGNETTIIIK